MKMTESTERLLLKILTPTAANDILLFYEENKACFEPWEPDRASNFYTEEFQKNSLKYEYDQCIKFRFLRYYIFEKENPYKIIGSVCFNNFIYGSFLSCNIGYKIAYPCCNKGYATEACKKATNIIFQDYHLHRIEAYISPFNFSSIAIANKLGFQHEGIAYSSVKQQGKWYDYLRYALINPEQ